jgi:hypothetical protein
VDAEFVHLMHDLQSTEITGHKYRGYTLLTEDCRKLRSVKVKYMNKYCSHAAWDIPICVSVSK